MALSAPLGMSSEDTTLSYGTQSASASYTALGKITNMSIPSMSVAAVDITELVDNVKQFAPGVKDYGEMSVSLLYSKANSLVIQTQFDGVPRSWQITFPDSGTLSFDGIISSLGGEVSEGGDAITQEISIKLTGDQPVVWVAA